MTGDWDPEALGEVGDSFRGSRGTGGADAEGTACLVMGPTLRQIRNDKPRVLDAF